MAFCIAVFVLTFYLFAVNVKNYNPKAETIIKQFYIGLKNTNISRCYPIFMITRKLAFAALVMFMSERVDRTVIYSLLIFLQVSYLVHFVSPLLLNFIYRL